MSVDYTFCVSSETAGKSLELSIPRQFSKAFEARYGYGTNDLPVHEVYELRQLVAVFLALKPLSHAIEIDPGADNDVDTSSPGWYRIYVSDPETGEMTSSAADIEIMAKLRWWAGQFAKYAPDDSAFDVYDLDKWFFDCCEIMLRILNDMALLVQENKDSKVQSIIG